MSLSKAYSFKILALGGGLLILGATLYLSWLPSPVMALVHWLPTGVARWADNHDQLRTAVPFLLLAFFSSVWIIQPGKLRKTSLSALILLMGLAFLVELVQLAIPNRVFDVVDIFWGCAGSIIGIAVVILIHLIFRAFREGNLSRRPDVALAARPIDPDASDPLSVRSMHIPLYFLGLRFWNDETSLLLREMDTVGGMLSVPSAPSLAQAAEDPLLLKAYQSSDWSVMDGGYVALIVRLFGRSVRRISGLQLIEKMTGPAEHSPIPLRDRRVMWVIPSMLEGERIRKYLSKQSFDKDKQNYYLAPFYKSDEEFDDRQLIAAVRELDPDWIILCLGGGRQEKLGYYLREATLNASQRPVILCTGAAIAFFTGGQANIPTWADRLYLGWLLRIMSKPQDFLPRYVKAAWHFPLVLWRQRGTWFDHPPG